ncbi:outer membrane beta-barrel protein [Chryseobacterium taichungense]|uniref:outer membrane beta-barrel protein n=1 Tax=Chryseobacterium taichungense TaxID=295069 RepID=UPI0028AC9BC2|nr:outer membrane beta-barrel protein [Chryseobacterium taichungense]
MINRYLLLVVILFLNTYLYAQENFSIEGILINKDHSGVGQVTVKLHNQNIFRISTTNNKGQFSFSNLPASTYTLEITSIIYDEVIKEIVVDKNFDIGPIVLNDKVTELQEVKIKAKELMPLPTGILLNVDGTSLKAKDNALNIINYAPSVTTHDGIKIMGNSNVQIQLDGKIINIENDKNALFLSTIKASNIKKIEVIDRPTAALDGNKSGIINIITKNNDGFNGNVSSNFMNNAYFGNSTDLSLFYAKNKLRIYGLAYLSYHKSRYNTDLDIITPYTNYQTTESGKLRRDEKNFVFGGEYTFNQKNSLSFLFDNSQDNDRDHEKNTQTAVIPAVNGFDNFHTFNRLNQYDKTNTLSFIYERKLDSLQSKISVTADYANNAYKNPIYQTNTFWLNSAEIVQQDNLQSDNASHDIYALTVNYKKMFTNKSNLSLGYKNTFVFDDFNYTYADLVNGSYINNDTYSNTFHFNQNLYTLFSSYSLQHKKSTYSLGLRGEYNYNKYHNSFIADESDNFFLLPTFLHNIKLNDNHTVYYYATNRIIRPSNSSYNPTFIKNNPINGSEGNEKLDATEIYRLQTGYVLKNKYRADVQYNYTENNIFSVPELKNGVIISSMKNGGYKNDVNIYLTVPVRISDWWEMTNKLNFSYFNFKYLNNNFSSGYGHFETLNTFTLPHKITLDLSYFYTSKYKSLYTTYQYTNNLNLTINYPVTENWKLNVGVNDIFNSLRNRVYYNINEIQNHYYTKFNTRSIFLSINYNFSVGKEVSEKTNKSNIEEEKNRLR